MVPSVQLSEDLPCPLRDGVVLRADVYRPADRGKYPVLLCRTPYDKKRAEYRAIAACLAERGYVAVVQDIRGRNASEGQWMWHMCAEGRAIEAEDGFEACQWAAGLRGADGQVGTWGNSYPSWLIWRMAAARPPALKAIFNSGFAARTLECTYGVFETGIRLRWQHHMAVSSRRRSGVTGFPRTVAEANHNWDRLLRGRWIWHLPLDEVPDALFGPDAAMQRRYWSEIDQELWALDADYPIVEVPTMTLTGWWDRLSQCSFHFTGMRRDGPPATRELHRLSIGPWVHEVESQTPWQGPRPQAPAGRLDLVGELTRWYDHHLKGRDTLDTRGPVRLFLLNESGWRRFDDWPPQEAQPTPLFLSSGGAANTPSGDGTLVFQPPGAQAPDRYDYDPADPVLSLVGPDGQAAACDQAPLAARRDILVYQTPPLTEDVVLAGPISCRLWIASDAPDTDFFVRLIEVGADGMAVNISQGLMRCRYRLGYDRPVSLEPDTATTIDIAMLPVGIRFRRGARIRVDVTSSDFPSFDRNHNTGRPFQSDPELRVARQTVFHDVDHPSHIVLPVLTDG
ncbi:MULTISPECIES: CocE/NonD family hydrolase [unclassified Roseitalea]|uniref:CocE/NonD family hydrolase n=1 Tax=unclassified Roseitalea TaxID=2639107 RepID=UPI00273D7181|nr:MULTISPECIES: CocE/NonD family hydrolase [unclassified Roseitalea]